MILLRQLNGVKKTILKFIKVVYQCALMEKEKQLVGIIGRKELSIMRLWHYKLLPVLPNKFIIAEWRECIAIKRQWEKGTLKHRLVSYVMDHHKSYFYRYVWDVAEEMRKRNIKFQKKYLSEIAIFTGGFTIACCNPYYSEHNDRYLRQCYFNLKEKADRGIITEEEWQKISENTHISMI